jgi:hypothetical protein
VNILEIFRTYNVPYVTQGDPHVTSGWAGMSCPWCTGKPGNYLGVNLAKVWFRCWRCGHHPQVETIAALCHIGIPQAWTIYRSLDGVGNGGDRYQAKDQAAQKRIAISPYRRPSDIDRMKRRHRDYLASRNFDPDEIERVWDVAGTGPASYLDEIDYRHRLFVPIHWEGHEATFQARDITGKSDTKYRACPMDREAVHHKHIIYANPTLTGRTGICVEGVTDAWRLGPLAFATFGIQFKLAQVRAIITRFDRVAIAFDGGERQARMQAQKLEKQLGSLISTKIFALEDGIDPGSMTQDDAQHLVAEVSRWGNLM